MRVKSVENARRRAGQHALRAIEVLRRDWDTVERQGVALGKPLIGRIGHIESPLRCRRDIGIERLDLVDRFVIGACELTGRKGSPNEPVARFGEGQSK